MMIRSMRTAAVLSAAAMALSACNGNGNGGGGGGGGGDTFFGQTFDEDTLGDFLDDADAGEKISITQHTGSMTLSDVDFDIDDIIDFLFFGEELPVLAEGATVAATADGSDENPAHLELTDTDNFIFRIASTGDLEMVVENDNPEDDGFLLGETIDDDPAVGDDVAAVLFTLPGVDAPVFGVLDYTSVVAWATRPEPAEDATEVTVDFGVGHMGLATPEEDIPAEGAAVYHGGFVGIFVVPGTDGADFVGTATGHAVFTADFAAGTVEGDVGINVLGIELGVGDNAQDDVGSIDFEDVTIDGNTFTGSVVPAEDGGFADFDVDSEGTLDGAFYGPAGVGGPAEAGAVLTLHDATEGSGAFLTGVIGAEIGIDD